MKIIDRLVLLGTALLTIANSNCSVMSRINPYSFKEIPVGEYVIIGEGTIELVKKTISNPPISGKKLSLEQALGLADNNPPDKNVTYPEAKKFAENYEKHIRYAF